MSTQPATIGHDAASALLQIAPDQLNRLVAAGHVRRAAPGKYVPAQIIRDYIAHLHAEPGRHEGQPTQQEIAAHLDMSDRNLRDVLQAVGLDHKQVPLSVIRIAYIRKLREEAAGRGGEGSLELASERARLAKEQADKIAMQNAVTRGELAPAYVLEEVLSRAGARAARLLETIPGTLRRRVPLLTSDDITVITSIVAKARNMAAAMKLADVDADDDAATDDALPVDHKDEAA
ncbi:terminase small subunit [Stenotrophomonas sp. CW117]|uniref:terminase small subunit n=1 Tax=Stenotrophomonas TaxID=40323 RepID=UPI0017812B9B|nr:terminase small subunit [Stenotrophomonas sp. CW117]QOF99788.1 terminase small subunit [Stenotrophomonas sp. CW117]